MKSANMQVKTPQSNPEKSTRQKNSERFVKIQVEIEMTLGQYNTHHCADEGCLEWLE